MPGDGEPIFGAEAETIAAAALAKIKKNTFFKTKCYSVKINC